MIGIAFKFFNMKDVGKARSQKKFPHARNLKEEYVSIEHPFISNHLNYKMMRACLMFNAVLTFIKSR